MINVSLDVPVADGSIAPGSTGEGAGSNLLTSAESHLKQGFKLILAEQQASLSRLSQELNEAVAEQLHPVGQFSAAVMDAGKLLPILARETGGILPDAMRGKPLGRLIGELLGKQTPTTTNMTSIQTSAAGEGGRVPPGVLDEQVIPKPIGEFVDSLVSNLQRGGQPESLRLPVFASSASVEGAAPSFSAGTFQLAASGPAGIGTASANLQSLPSHLQMIDAPVGGKGWETAIGERIVWMLGREVQSAEVKLNPPSLGPLEIRVSVHSDQASVSFAAQHLVTREALEAAIPRLREMLGDANLNLVDVEVGNRDASGRTASEQQTEDSSSGYGSWSGDDPLTGHAEADTGVRRVVSGLVDDYA